MGVEVSDRVSSAAAPPAGRHFGLLAEFEDVGSLMHAAEKVRDAGYKRWDCHSPFPIHGLDRAMGLRDTRLPWVVLLGGFVGAGAGVGLQWWTNAVNYPFLISGKPFFSLPANIPVVFELTVLISSVAAFLCMFLFNGLPRFYHPTFNSERFRRVTDDRFFIVVESRDPRFEAERTERLLRELGSRHVEWLEE
jgi:hypothetical protein